MGLAVEKLPAYRKVGLFHTQYIGGLPRKVLTPINTDQLPGHSARRQEIAQRIADARRISAAPQNRGRTLPGEMLGRLARALKRGARPNGIHPQLVRQSLCRCPGQRP